MSIQRASSFDKTRLKDQGEIQHDIGKTAWVCDLPQRPFSYCEEQLF